MNSVLWIALTVIVVMLALLVCFICVAMMVAVGVSIKNTIQGKERK